MGLISGTVFSMADLDQPERHLYGKIKLKGKVIEVELLFENQENEMTEVMFKDGTTDEVPTKKLYDLADQKKRKW